MCCPVAVLQQVDHAGEQDGALPVYRLPVIASAGGRRNDAGNAVTFDQQVARDFRRRGHDRDIGPSGSSRHGLPGHLVGEDAAVDIEHLPGDVAGSG